MMPLISIRGFAWQKRVAVVHLGTVLGNVAKHAFIRGVDKIFHAFENIEPENIRKIKYRPGPLHHLNTSEANILSIVHNHGILREFLYPEISVRIHTSTWPIEPV